jgi:solute:Na+ symporter, SSS family
MNLAAIDWFVIALFLGASLVIGVLVSRRAGASAESFFLSGRNMPWWLLGFSMVATTFAADTPLLVTDIVRSNGVAGNWVWWAFLLTGMLTTFVYARLWRRSGVFTDLEFYELRYSGRPASAVRAFRAIYLGVFFNVMVMATVCLAAIKISAIMLGASPIQTIAVAGTITLVYSVMGGFVGVVLSDLLLFFVAMIGAIAAAWFALDHPAVGSLGNLLAQPQLSGKLSLLPDFSRWDQALMIFIIPITLQWWNVWYPGSEPGGGGYVAQRMLAARNERHAMGAVLLFQVAHYALRPWPWIIVALASLLVFPDVASIQAAFPDIAPEVVGHDLAYPAMLTFLPAGVLGLVLASLASAFMSTMSTQINWGSSYVMNDVYKRFWRPDASEKELVRCARLTSAALMLMACTASLFLESALQAFNILLSIGAGTGLIFILRWFWWRISAYSEIAAMVVSFAAAVYFQSAELPGWQDWQKLLAPIAITTVAWVAVTLITPATDMQKLRDFYLLIRPAGKGWEKVRSALEEAGEVIPASAESIPHAILNVLYGTVAIYGLLFAIGYLLYGQYLFGMAILLIAAIAAFLVYRGWARA